MIIKSRERWKKITHIDGILYNFTCDYYISNYGRVESTNGTKGDRILKNNMREGYYRCLLSYIYNNKRINKRFNVHRLVYEYFCKYDVYNKNNEIHHKDGNSTNNYYKNLEAMSLLEHRKKTREMSQLTPLIGKLNGMTKHSEETIETICKLLEDGFNYKYINKITDVKIYNIKNIKSKRSWTHISNKYDI